MSMHAFIVVTVALALLVGLFWALFRILVPKKGPPMVCTNCGNHGAPKRITRGSTAIELVLWLCFIVPGLIYSLWRLTTRRQGCAECGAAALVPPGSPVGQRMIRESAPPP